MSLFRGGQLARIEEQARGVREDVQELTAEMNRTRGRLHDLEGTTAMFVEAQKENRRREEAQYQRLALRMQVAAVIVAVAAVVVPILTVLLTGK